MTSSARARRRSSSTSAAIWLRQPTTPLTPRTTRRTASSPTPRGAGRWQQQLRRRLQHPQPRGAGHTRWRQLRRAHGRCAEFRQGRRRPGAGEPGHPARVGHPPLRLGVGVDLQQELVPRVSLDVNYNRRWFGNFTVTDNQARQAIRLSALDDRRAGGHTAPWRRRLPDTNYTQTAAAAARAAQNYVTFETDFGPARTNYWQGVDVTVNARTRQRSRSRAAPVPGARSPTPARAW